MARISYAGNFGQSDLNVPNSAGMKCPDTSKASLPETTGSYDKIADGTNTMLASEIIPGIRHAYADCGGPRKGLTQQEYPPNSQTPDAVRVGRCGDSAVNAATKALPVRESIPINQFYINIHTARSAPSRQINITMCDGSVNFVGNDIDLIVRRAMGTPNGGEVFEKTLILVAVVKR